MKIEADSSAKAYAKEQIDIKASAEKVYAILSDINNWPLWQSSVKKATINGTVEEDKEFKWKAGGMKINSKLHTVKSPSQLGWTGRIGWITAVHNWTITESNGESIVVVEESLKGFLSGTMKKSLREGMSRNLEELKFTTEMN